MPQIRQWANPMFLEVLRWLSLSHTSQPATAGSLLPFPPRPYPISTLPCYALPLPCAGRTPTKQSAEQTQCRLVIC